MEASSAAPQEQAALPSPSDAAGFAERLATARAAAEAEVAAPVDAPPPGGPDAGTPEAPSPSPTPDAPAPDGPQPDDGEPNPDLPHLTKGQTRRLFEQWEAVRRPRFLKELDDARSEAERLRAEAEQAAASEAQTRSGYEQWYGPDDQYTTAEQVYDRIVASVRAGQYVPDEDLQAAGRFERWRDNRRMASAVNHRELTKVIGNVDRMFREAKISGVDVPALLAEVTAKGGHPGTVLETLAAKLKQGDASEWKGKYEAERSAHEATRARLGLGRAATGEGNGRAPTKADLVGAMRVGTADADSLIERAKRGELAHLDLRD